MALNSFVAKEPRPLPIFVLADTSGSMRGDKINELNLALREMLTVLKETDDVRGKFQLSVIGFGGEVKEVQSLKDIDDMELPELEASGNTPMGATFKLVAEMIEDREIVSSRAYAPTIILISDGLPTDCTEEMYELKNYDEWEPMQALHTGERCSKCQRLALGVGDDVDKEMLKAFINNAEIPVITARDASGISKFFKWVTLSTVARMNSVNPNQINVEVPFLGDEKDIWI